MAFGPKRRNFVPQNISATRWVLSDSNWNTSPTLSVANCSWNVGFSAFVFRYEMFPWPSNRQIAEVQYQHLQCWQQISHTMVHLVRALHLYIRCHVKMAPANFGAPRAPNFKNSEVWGPKAIIFWGPKAIKYWGPLCENGVPLTGWVLANSSDYCIIDNIYYFRRYLWLYKQIQVIIV